MSLVGSVPTTVNSAVRPSEKVTVVFGLALRRDRLVGPGAGRRDLVGLGLASGCGRRAGGPCRGWPRGDDVVVGQDQAVRGQDDARALFGLPARVGLQLDDAGHHLGGHLLDRCRRQRSPRACRASPPPGIAPSVTDASCSGCCDHRCDSAADTCRYHRDGHRTDGQCACAGTLSRRGGLRAAAPAGGPGCRPDRSIRAVRLRCGCCVLLVA